MADTIKLSDLTSRFTAVTEDELFETSEYQGVPGDYLSKKVTKSILLGYKQFVGLLSQSGVANPTINQLCPDLGTVTIARTGIGVYQVTATGLLTLTKTMIHVGGVFNNGPIAFSIIQVGQTSLGLNGFIIYTHDDSLNLSDDILLDTPLEIRVYY